MDIIKFSGNNRLVQNVSDNLNINLLVYEKFALGVYTFFLNIFSFNAGIFILYYRRCEIQ